MLQFHFLPQSVSFFSEFKAQINYNLNNYIFQFIDWLAKGWNVTVRHQGTCG